MYNIDNGLLNVLSRTSLPIAPNRYSLEITKNRIEDFEKTRRSGIALWDNVNAENNYIKDLTYYNKKIEPIIESQEKTEAYNSSIIGQIENTIIDIDKGTNDFISNLIGKIDYKVYLFALVIIIIFIKI